MTKQQENRAFAKMLKEFPKVFGRVSFRERLMLRTAFTYVVEEIIVDLEKENAELRNNGFTVSAMTEQQLKVALKKGEQLEKENAELKKRVDNLYNSDCWASDQLAKAKEIIKRLKSLIEDVCDINYLSKNNTKLLEKAEQFLKEIEK